MFIESGHGLMPNLYKNSERISISHKVHPTKNIVKNILERNPLRKKEEVKSIQPPP